MRDLICSSHTISGVLPGGAVISRHSFENRVVAAAEAGYRGLCLHLRDYARERQAGRTDADLERTLRENGMVHVGIEFLTDWFMDGEAGRAAAEYERIAFAAAEAYGASVVNVGSDLQGRGLPFGRLRESFEALCERARGRGMSIALEIVAWSDVPDVGTALGLIHGIPNAGLAIDSWHVFRGGIALEDLARIPPDRILCVQLNDGAGEVAGSLAEDTMCRLLCGEGAFDLAGFIGTLSAIGVSVPFSVEIISPEQAERSLQDAARLSFATARQVWARL